MICTSDKSVVAAAVLTSDRLLQPEAVFTDDTVLIHAVADYQKYVSHTLRSDDITHMVKLHSVGADSENSEPLLSALADYYLQWQGNRFEVSPKKLDQWLELLTLLDPSWVIAQAYKDIAEQHAVSSHDIIAAISHYQCPFALSNDRYDRAYADNHVHLGGHGSLSPSLLSFSLYGQQLDDNIKWPRRSEYTLFESKVFKKQDLPIWCHHFGNEIIEQAFNDSAASPKLFNANNELDIQTDRDIFVYLQQKKILTKEQQYFVAAHDQFTSSAKRWLLYCMGVLTCTDNISQLKNLFIRVSSILRNYMVVSGVGLTQFVSHYSFKSRDMRDTKHQSPSKIDALFADMQGNYYRELRATPSLLLGSDDFPTDAKSLTKALHSLYKHSLEENIHFVLHFTRSGNTTDKFQEQRRKIVKRQVNGLQAFSCSSTFSDYEFKQLGLADKTPPKTFDLRKAIRGFDVAGNENELPIEVFAPALRVLREAKYQSKGIMFNRMQRPFLTVHTGEDFSHLLSGLRAIDEAVYYCDYQAGDRLGHALALGVFPRTWAKRQRVAYLTLDEHLDNLVWCYQKALEVVQQVPQFTGVLQLLNEKIQYWCALLYGQEYTCRTLYEAWKLRRNCPLTVNNKNLMEPGWAIDFDESGRTSGSENAFALWQQYVGDGVLPSRSKESVMIHCIPKPGEEPFGTEKGIFFDSISAAELELYEAIQDLQMEKYAAQEVIIEACPTSNIYIGRFKHHREHPIFRWDPPEQEWIRSGEKFNRFGLRKGAIAVCVNTDDSALMPTTIQNEHRILQQAAIEYYEVGVNKAEIWIERIRKKGIDVFQSNHLPWVNE
ncbi:antiviral RADAR system adenosine deaminase RdrB [Pseudoalteromonas byunsanensis]|uniref:Adenosine deaminase domain-containing protein n=1 Tax=Pseudoalteromonas byunsanensis TaxID=327939 RepID=A0A1S1N1W3_9GAMM|nr:antiviral RADAR system adenosine deaminase RdrB [Pseudoalteromonas byunsanensis]OHU93444.1 hypothetical protein BIW53_18975 [Pseudoalteromonas byunsanensis]